MVQPRAKLTLVRFVDTSGIVKLWVSLNLLLDFISLESPYFYTTIVKLNVC